MNIKDKAIPVEKLVVAVSSRALFDLDKSHAIFEKEGVDAYCRHQVEHEDVPLDPGVAFSLVKKLLALNERAPANPCVEVILLSRNRYIVNLRASMLPLVMFRMGWRTSSNTKLTDCYGESSRRPHFGTLLQVTNDRYMVI